MSKVRFTLNFLTLAILTLTVTSIAQAQATRCETRALLARSRALRERLAGPQPLRAGVVPLAALPAGAEPDGQVP